MLDLRDCLRLLTPYDLVDGHKVRFGRDFDGGYILDGDLDPISTVYSFGIGDEISFEYDLARRGKRVYAHDHTVSGLPYGHDNIDFRPEGLGARNDPGSRLFTLAYQIARNGDEHVGDMLLKLDVEGAEYEVLPHLSSATLAQFRQIALEIHWLSKLGDPAFRLQFYRTLRHINEQFVLFHVHGNNCCPLAMVEGFVIADVLELTYIRRDLAQPVRSQTVYPTVLDRANDHRQPDHLLWFYPFVPVAGIDGGGETSPPLPKPAALPKAAAADAGTDPFRQRRLNVLYFSCSEGLEYDDLRMLTDSGHRVFSIGAFSDPGHPPQTRQPHPAFHHEGDWSAFRDTGGDLGQRLVGRDFARQFDIAIITHDPTLIQLNLSALGDMPIVYRTVGSSIAPTEAVLASVANRVHIVRCSDKEVGLPGFCRSDDVIYFGKYLDEFPRWVPGSRILTFYDAYPQRSSVTIPKLESYNAIAKDRPLDLYGFANQGASAWRGVSSPVQQTALLRNAALYFYVHSAPVSYASDVVEAMAIGVPVLAPSAKLIMRELGAAAVPCGFVPERYELEDLLDLDDRLLYDSTEEAGVKLQLLMDDLEYRLDLSKRLRKRCREFFDANKIRTQWERLLQSLV